MIILTFLTRILTLVSVATSASPRKPSNSLQTTSLPTTTTLSSTATVSAQQQQEGTSTASVSATVADSLAIDRGVLTPSSKVTRENIIEIHALLMWIGFLICPSIGAFIARFMKRKLGHNWFRFHASIMSFGSIAALAGILTIILYTPSSRHFSSSHAKLGIVMISFMGIQILLGIMSNILFNVKRSIIPLQDKLHWWMGRLLVLLALVQIQAGWSLYQALGYNLSPLVLITHYFIVAVILCCFVTAELKLGPFYHVSSDHKRFSIA